MADIAFLLLVFFMVTSVLKVDADIPLVLPDAKGRELKEKDLNLSISKNKRIFFNNIPVSLPEAMARVEIEVQKKPDVKILINAHKSLKFDQVHEILDGLKGIGAKNFALVTKQNERSL